MEFSQLHRRSRWQAYCYAKAHSGSIYYNYKQTFSIVLMVMVNANYKFIYADIGCNGRVSDGGVFQNCSLSNALETNLLNIPKPKPLPEANESVPFVVVADDAFPLKPYDETISVQKSKIWTESSNFIITFYNYRLSRARRSLENAFGLTANRFRILRRVILLEPEKVRTVVSAIIRVCLHNFLMTGDSRQIYASPGVLDNDTEERITNGSWRDENLSNNTFFFT